MLKISLQVFVDQFAGDVFSGEFLPQRGFFCESYVCSWGYGPYTVYNCHWCRGFVSLKEGWQLAQRVRMGSGTANWRVLYDSVPLLRVLTTVFHRYNVYCICQVFCLQVVPLMLIPVAYRIIKLLARREGIFDKLRAYTVPIVNDVKHWTDDRSEVVAPSLLKNLITYAKIGDRKVRPVKRLPVSIPWCKSNFLSRCSPWLKV